jgi:hypothetical protein
MKGVFVFTTRTHKGLRHAVTSSDLALNHLRSNYWDEAEVERMLRENHCPDLDSYYYKLRIGLKSWYTQKQEQLEYLHEKAVRDYLTGQG